MRQIERDIKNEVWDSLKPIWADLWPEADALQRVRHDRDRAKIVPELSDKRRELSDSQDLATAMVEQIKRERENQNNYSKIGSYSFTIKQPSVIYPTPAPEKQADTWHDLSESEAIAVAMIERHRQADREQPEQATSEPIQALNDNKVEIERAEIERLKEQQRQALERGRGRGGYRR